MDNPASAYARARALLAQKDLVQGMALMLEAAHDGDGEAAHFIALSLATDMERLDRWEYALAYLGRAAKARHGLARRTLAFLAGEGGADIEALSDDDLHRLHDRIDVAAWLPTPRIRVLKDSPQLRVIEGLVPPRVLPWIVQRYAPKLQPAQIYTGAATGTVAAQRSNSMAGLEFAERDLAIVLVAEAVSRASGFTFAEMENPVVLHYRPGQEFKPHYDFFDPAIPTFDEEIAARGQRMATLLLYLNDEYEGGETDFPNLNIRFRGRPGDALLFFNVEGGAPDFRTLHAGLSPTRGEKWLYSQWLRRRG